MIAGCKSPKLLIIHHNFTGLSTKKAITTHFHAVCPYWKGFYRFFIIKRPHGRAESERYVLT